jgi:hypothetical protein
MKHTSFMTASAFLAALALCATPAAAQSRGHGSSRGGAVVGRAVQRVGPAPRFISPRIVGRVPYRPYYYSYRPGIRLGLYGGYGYPYDYGYYGYPYAYGYPYGYSTFGYGYGGYYPPPPVGYISPRGGYDGYGGVRIKGADRNAQVFADGYYVGIVDDFDGTFQHLNLEGGAHRIEIRSPNAPPIAFDVNVQPGQTITYHADIR